MKFPLLIFLLTFALGAAGQTSKSPPVTKTSKSAPSAKKAGTAAGAPVRAHVKNYYLILPAADWAQLLQLLDQSNAPHLTVKAFIEYIQKNAKEVPIAAVPDSAGRKQP